MADLDATERRGTFGPGHLGAGMPAPNARGQFPPRLPALELSAIWLGVLACCLEALASGLLPSAHYIHCSYIQKRQTLFL
jgi:hypothetical protein